MMTKSKMKSRNLVLLSVKPAKTVEEFVDHWRAYYQYGDSERYSLNIKARKFTPTNLRELYRWKNGMTLEGSGTKEKSLEKKITSKTKKINQFKLAKRVDLDAFNKEFANISAVWRIFLLHIIKPRVYPMYDQHVHRAYLFIHGKDWSGIHNKISNEKKLQFYFEHYYPFVKQLNYSNLKSLDEALFAFGQYLNIKKQGVNLWK